jgi:hypothetical protein
MSSMIGSEQHLSRPSVQPGRALLMLGLLVGLLGMHALAPGGISPHRESPSHRAAAVAVQDGCADDGHGGGSHIHHADATCASGAVSTGVDLPPLVADARAVVTRDGTLCSYASLTPAGARAPPSLSELQLLRI